MYSKEKEIVGMIRQHVEILHSSMIEGILRSRRRHRTRYISQMRGHFLQVPENMANDRGNTRNDDGSLL